MGLFGELKRRNVFRVAGVYAVVGWLLVQIAAAIEAAMFLPAWFDTVVVSFLVLGFPIALIFAWAFELTPEGIKPTTAVAPEDSITHQTANRLDLALVVALLLFSVAVLAPQLIGGDPDNPVATIGSQSETSTGDAGGRAGGDESRVEASNGPPSASIAVLPFADLSPDGNQKYFADGVSEELLNVLAQVDALKVAGRTSSFAFRGRNADLKEIGRTLKVSHILEGSVRSQGQHVRVTAQLIQVSDGYHLWSQTYDSNLGDIFAVQDDIAQQILAALRQYLGLETTAQLAPVTRTEVSAYSLFQEARDLIFTRDASNLRRALALLDRVIAIDETYAPAYAARGKVYLLLSDMGSAYGDIPARNAFETAETDVRKALDLNPRLGDAHAVRGLLYSHRGNYEFGLASLRRALELNPNLLDARYWFALRLQDSGRIRAALDELLVLRDIDPLFRPAAESAFVAAVQVNDIKRATSVANGFASITSDPVDALIFRGMADRVNGRPAAALQRWFQVPAADRERQLAYAMASVALGLGENPARHGIRVDNVKDQAETLAKLGRRSEALALVDQAITDDPEVYAQFVHLAILSGVGAHQRLLDYFDNEFAGDLDVYSARLSSGASNRTMSHFGLLARAAFATGSDELFEASMQRWREAMDRARTGGAASWAHDLDDARYWAMRGNPQRAVDFIESAFSKRTILPFYVLSDSVFDRLSIDPRFVALRNSNSQRINAERESLGWAPLSEQVFVEGY